MYNRTSPKNKVMGIYKVLKRRKPGYMHLLVNDIDLKLNFNAEHVDIIKTCIEKYYNL